MNNKVDLIKVSTDDWTALYKNGVNTWDGHSLDINEVLQDLIGYEITSYKSYWIDSDVIEDVYGCDFPSKLESINENHLQ